MGRYEGFSVWKPARVIVIADECCCVDAKRRLGLSQGVGRFRLSPMIRGSKEEKVGTE